MRMIIFFFQAEDGIRDYKVTGVQTCALPICHGQPLSVALVDMDGMQALNAELGHAMGDAALVHVAQLARQGLRPEDVVGRYEGQAFVLLLPQTPETAGAQALQRLLQRSEEHTSELQSPCNI